MRRRNYHKSRRERQARMRTLLVIGVVVVFCCLIGYCASRADNDDERMSQLAGSADEQELTLVVTPDYEDARMLHYPGFDVFFSNNHHQPYYVTWVLTPEHARSNANARSNNFRPDPEVEGSAQLADYKRSGYDRGHMAPAADFKYAQDAMDATFFLTNMCPQSNSLNSGAWATLEDLCRAWAIRDSTLIIVSGPVLTDYLTETIGETKVTVPDRFFKVVYAPYANPPRAIGFVMPNQKVPGGVQASATSVDNVEAITGMDFFSVLPDELEDKIEAEVNFSKWQKKR